MTHEHIAEPLVLTIVALKRGKADRVTEWFAQSGITFNLVALGRGTAKGKALAYLGLDESAKDFIFSTMPLSLSREMLNKVGAQLYPGPLDKGIAFSIPLSAIVTERAERCLRGTQIEQGGASMEQEFHHDLIIAVTNLGYVDDVMDAARAVGVPGGTVLHARRVGTKQAEKFFGVPIHPEKEMLFILVKREDRARIMEAIVEKNGLHTDAKTIVFSLPVNSVAGLPSVE